MHKILKKSGPKFAFESVGVTLWFNFNVGTWYLSDSANFIA